MMILGFILQIALAGSSCNDLAAKTCEYLKSGPKGVLSQDRNQTILINPLSLKSEYPEAQRKYFLLQNANQQNFRNQIQPLFEELKQNLILEVGRLSNASPYKQNLMTLLSTVKIEIFDRERCQRPTRIPIAAGYDKEKNKILLCPFVTHLPKTSLVSLLAHELGHLMDLCDLGEALKLDLNRPETCQNSSTGILQGFAFSSIHCCSAKSIPYSVDKDSPEAKGRKVCDRDSENWSDFVSTVLMSKYLEKHAPEFSTDKKIALVQLNFFRMESMCSTEEKMQRYSYNLIQSKAARSFLNCEEIGADTTCSVEEVQNAVDKLSF